MGVVDSRVNSDTAGLRDRPTEANARRRPGAGSPHRSPSSPPETTPVRGSRRLCAAVLVAVSTLAACGARGSPSSSTEADRARALLDPSSALPARAEVVALADAIAIAAAKDGKT